MGLQTTSGHIEQITLSFLILFLPGRQNPNWHKEGKTQVEPSNLPELESEIELAEVTQQDLTDRASRLGKVDEELCMGS